MESLEKCGRPGGVATVLAAVPDIIVKKARRALEDTLKTKAPPLSEQGRRQRQSLERCGVRSYTPSSSTSKIKVAFGGIAPPAPRAP
jgi:hypothetical protein